MYISIHMIQNHSPANLNRDDLGAPKTCYFGGVLRSRVSSQCLKRSIRLSHEFSNLLGGIRTRRLADLLVKEIDESTEKASTRKRAEKILEKCGIKTKQGKSKGEEVSRESSKMLVYTTREAIREMAALLRNGKNLTDDRLVEEFSELIQKKTAVPDMALSGRMLETGVLTNTTVEAALQVAHAISTHEARPEVDYFVAADDVREFADDAGAGYVDEAMFNSACFYKYFSINWEQLVDNLRGNDALAAHTVGAFLRGATLANPSGKQNSFAAHNLPDGIVVELRDVPVSYANAFSLPVEQKGGQDVIERSIVALGQYMLDLDAGYTSPTRRFWFSPNLRFQIEQQGRKSEKIANLQNTRSLDELIENLIGALGYDWADVREAVVESDALAGES